MEIEIKRKRKIAWWWFVIPPVLLTALFAAQLLAPNPSIRVGRSTTFISTPLRADGTPDYAAHVVQRAGAGTRPSENAAAMYWRALWPGELDARHHAPLCGALGIPVPDPDRSLAHVQDKSVASTLAQWLSVVQGIDPSGEQANSRAIEIMQRAMTRPWTSDDVAPLETWIRNNQQALDWLVEGASRPKYFSPPPNLVNGSDEGLLLMLLPGVHMLRSADRSLRCRAMWHVGEGRPMAAWRDILACHRIARHASQGITLVEQLVAVALGSTACTATQTLLHHGDLSSADLAQIDSDLKSLARLPAMGNAIENGERLFFLDCVTRLATGRMQMDEFGAATSLETPLVALLGATRIDWNIVMEEGNRWYDRMVEAAKLPRAHRIDVMTELDADLQQLGLRSNPAMVVGGVFSANARSQLTADVLLQLFLPALNATFEASDRAAVATELTLVCASLARYRATHGSYPDSLGEMVPKFIDKLPLDLYSGKPFVYRRNDEGYVLYSVFRNSADDGGDDINGYIAKGEWTKSKTDVNLDNGDLVVLVPRQTFDLRDLDTDD